MPVAVQNSGTIKYETFEERRYFVRVLGCKDSKSPLDGRDQYEWEFAIEGTEDADTGREMTTRKWCSTVWNDTTEKESHLVIMARALFGRPVTFEEWEGLSFDELRDLRASALVVRNAKGYPDLDKTTFRAAQKAAPPARAATTPPAAVAPPPAPAAPTGVGMTDKLRHKIARLIASSEYDESEIAAHCQREFGAAAWDGLTEEQGRHLAAQLIEGELIPF